MRRWVLVRRGGLVLAIGILGFCVAGCEEDKLTRARFEMITIDIDDKYDVEKLIGPPNDKVFEMWSYERVDKHLNVFVHFNEDHVVARKEWHDTLNDVHIDSTSVGDRPVYESTTIRRFED